MTTAARTVTWRCEAKPTSMGMHHYESRIQQAVRDTADSTWTFGISRVGNLRGNAECEIRFPARLRNRGGHWLAPLVARRAPGLTHRFDLRLPPGRREVVTVHDLPPRRFPDEGMLPDWCLASARRALEVIVPSEFAAAEVAELTGAERITVVPYGLSPEFAEPHPASSQTLASLGVTRPFFVHAAGATTRKNLLGLADAWRRLKVQDAEHQLVLCGPPHHRRDQAFAGLPNVVMLGRQPLETVAGLMAASTAVVVPSLYEGFGLPALEGMACGVPVVAAHAGALPEVCADAAVLTEPTGEALSVALSAVIALTSEQRQELIDRGRRRARSFDWQSAADAHLAVYERHL